MELGVGSGECEVWNVEDGKGRLWSGKRGLWNGKCGV